MTIEPGSIAAVTIDLVRGVHWVIVWTGPRGQPAPLLDEIYDERGRRVTPIDPLWAQDDRIAGGYLPAGNYRVVLRAGARSLMRELRLGGVPEVTLRVGPDE